MPDAQAIELRSAWQWSGQKGQDLRQPELGDQNLSAKKPESPRPHGIGLAAREGDTLVGRSDPVTGITPDVDLTPLDPQRSTSRRHAKLYQMSDTFYVMEEIGVMNGTYVNGNRVATGVPIAVQNGDVLKFGLVALTFHSPET